MELLDTITGLRQRLDGLRAAGSRIGMVGTSGAVHEGHLSLVRAAAAANDYTVVFWGGGASIGWMPGLAYQRDYDRDAALMASAGAGAIFMPPGEELFPRQPLTQVRLPEMSSRVPSLEDPAHLDLIAMVMAKLWNIVGPCRMYSGEKDWQQLAMFQRLADDLSFPIDVVPCPTVRHEDGVALSSRNDQLSPAQRDTAPALYRALCAAHAAVCDGERDADTISTCFTEAAGDADVEYFVAVDAATINPLEKLEGEVRLLGSIRIGTVRLVDNVGVTAP